MQDWRCDSRRHCAIEVGGAIRDSNRAGGRQDSGSGWRGASRRSVKEVNCSRRLKRSGHWCVCESATKRLRSEEEKGLV
ncbi:hypothetical protein ACOSP7_011420 [Xanthoceras sorbifolium]